MELVTRSENMKKYWDNHKGNATKQYFGRYNKKTGIYTTSDGAKVKMSVDEYLNYVKTTRESKIARKIARKYI